MADKKYVLNPLNGELIPVEDFDQIYAKRGHTHASYAQVDPTTKKLASSAAHDILAEYSADGVSWHKALQPDDRYLRLSSNGGETWGEKISFSAVGSGAPRWCYELEQATATSPLAWTVDKELMR